MNRVILTKETAENIISTQKLGHPKLLTTLDLGCTETDVDILEGFVVLAKEKVSIQVLKNLKENTCYVLEDGEFKSIDFFGEDTNLFYKLKPALDWPTLTLSSVPMHRFKHISPKKDTESKINEVSPLFGRVLDTCCGLGYTAISAAKSDKVEEVVVFERDKNVLRIAEYNPFSQELFSNNKIKLKNESAFEGIKTIKKNYFDRIIHDPPTVSFAKELYSSEFYKELFRVLSKRGILYHYCPNPGKTKGGEFWPRVKERLEKIGFVNVEYHKSSSGLKCEKKQMN
ncbi:MAG: methyltransferase [Candidatus Diapherotrites archaeon]|nr:methyltransferase [Candidatus Diapherotrites archaeon]